MPYVTLHWNTQPTSVLNHYQYSSLANITQDVFKEPVVCHLWDQIHQNSRWDKSQDVSSIFKLFSHWPKRETSGNAAMEPCAPNLPRDPVMPSNVVTRWHKQATIGTFWLLHSVTYLVDLSFIFSSECFCFFLERPMHLFKHTRIDSLVHQVPEWLEPYLCWERKKDEASVRFVVLPVSAE